MIKVRIETQDGNVVEQPIDLPTLEKWIEDGILTADDEVWSDTLTGGVWRRIGDLPIFKRIILEKQSAGSLLTKQNQKERTTMIKYCSNCGSPIKVNAKFCENCGSRVLLTESSEISVSGNKCYYCKSEMALDAIKCPKCGKYLQEIEKDKDKVRILCMIGVLFFFTAILIVWMTPRYQFVINPQLRTYVIGLWVIGVVIGLFSIPPWIRVSKRTGQWIWF